MKIKTAVRAAWILDEVGIAARNLILKKRKQERQNKKKGRKHG